MFPSLLTSVLTGEAGQIAKRAKSAAIAYALIAVFGVIAIGFLIGAGFIYAEAIYGPLHTALGFAGGFLALALIVLLVFKLTSRAKAKRLAEKRRNEMAGIAAASALAIIPTLLRGRSAAGIVGLPLAALIIAQIYRENSGNGNDDHPDEDDE